MPHHERVRVGTRTPIPKIVASGLRETCGSSTVTPEILPPYCLRQSEPMLLVSICLKMSCTYGPLPATEAGRRRGHCRLWTCCSHRVTRMVNESIKPCAAELLLHLLYIPTQAGLQVALPIVLESCKFVPSFHRFIVSSFHRSIVHRC